MRKLFVLLLVIGLCSAVRSAPVPDTPQDQKKQLPLDTGKISVHTFSEEDLNLYRKDKAFIYDRDEPQATSLWERFWSWVWKVIRKWFGHSKAPSPAKTNYLWVLKYAVLIAFALLVVFVIAKLMGVDLNIFARKPKAVDVPYTESMDNIHEINFNEEIEKAIANGNYRLAVRLFYLHVLKRLNDHGQIDWQPEKTNQAYILEIADPGKKQAFNQLTIQFEYVWYGEFFIDRENFNEIKVQYDRFNLEMV